MFIQDESTREDIKNMLRVQVGDMQAFEAIVLKYQKPMFNFFRKMGADRGLAEDLAQQTFLKLWKSVDKYFPKGKFSTYLFQIGKNEFINEYLKKKKRKEVSLNNLNNKDDTSSEFQFEADDESVEDKIASDETSEIIRAAVNKLDEKHRMVFVLAHFQELKYAEIAKILKIPLGTVKTRMMHAERKLRDILKHHFKDFK
ncbi:MAG: sigma-70 family RNA polymerase sigma factor [Planctomycetes bacterium]|nr:sigma-70 family RNA polymerase sigma factor [Planctomycetota bacterium]